MQYFQSIIAQNQKKYCCGFLKSRLHIRVYTARWEGGRIFISIEYSQAFTHLIIAFEYPHSQGKSREIRRVALILVSEQNCL